MTAAEIFLAVPLLAVASAFDVGARRIPNGVTVALAVSGTVSAFWGAGPIAALSSIIAAALVLTVLVPAWRLRVLGGGDVKLAVAAATWLGLASLPAFALATALAGGALSATCWIASSNTVRREVLANLRLAVHRAMPAVTIARGKGRVSVPYGAAVALGTIWVLSRG